MEFAVQHDMYLYICICVLCPQLIFMGKGCFNITKLFVSLLKKDVSSLKTRQKSTCNQLLWNDTIFDWDIHIWGESNDF